MAIRLEFVSDSKKAKADLAGLNRAVNNIDNTTQNASRSMQRFAKLASSAAVALGAIVSTRGLINISDRFTNIENRVALVTGRTKELTTTMAQLRKVAIDTRGGLEGVADLYNRLGRSTKSLGFDNTQVLAATKSIQKAITISGGSAESANAAILQLGQGLAAGALRGQELNSVMEQTPRVAQAIADELGVGIGQLRKMAEEGKLTSKVILKAFLNQGKAIDKEFGDVNATFSQVFKSLGDSVGFFINEFLKGTKLIQPLIRGIQNFAQSFQNAAVAAKGFGTAFGEALRAPVRLVRSIGNLLSAVFGQVSNSLPSFESAIVVSLLTVQTAFLKLSYAINKFTGEDLAAAGNAFDLFYHKVAFGILGISAFDDVLTKVAYNNVLEALTSKINSLANALSPSNFDLKGIGQDIATQVRALFDKDLLTDFADSAIGNTKRLFEQSVGYVKKLYTSVIDVFKDLRNDISDGDWGDLAKEVLELLTKGIQKSSKLIRAAFAYITIGIEILEEKFHWLYDRVIGNSWWTDLVEGVIEGAKDIYVKALPHLLAFGDRLEGVFSNLKDKAASAFDSIKDSSKQLGKKFDISLDFKDVSYKGITALAEKFTDAIADGFHRLKTDYPAVFTAIASLLAGVMLTQFEFGLKKRQIKLVKLLAGGSAVLSLGIINPQTLVNVFADVAPVLGKILGAEVGNALLIALNPVTWVKLLHTAIDALAEVGQGFLDQFGSLGKLLGKIPGVNVAIGVVTFAGVLALVSHLKDLIGLFGSFIYESALVQGAISYILRGFTALAVAVRGFTSGLLLAVPQLRTIAIIVGIATVFFSSIAAAADSATESIVKYTKSLFDIKAPTEKLVNGFTGAGVSGRGADALINVENRFKSFGAAIEELNSIAKQRFFGANGFIANLAYSLQRTIAPLRQSVSEITALILNAFVAGDPFVAFDFAGEFDRKVQKQVDAIRGFSDEQLERLEGYLLDNEKELLGNLLSDLEASRAEYDKLTNENWYDLIFGLLSGPLDAFNDFKEGDLYEGFLNIHPLINLGQELTKYGVFDNVEENVETGLSFISNTFGDILGEGTIQAVRGMGQRVQKWATKGAVVAALEEGITELEDAIFSISGRIFDRAEVRAKFLNVKREFDLITKELENTLGFELPFDFTDYLGFDEGLQDEVKRQLFGLGDALRALYDGAGNNPAKAQTLLQTVQLLFQALSTLTTKYNVDDIFSRLSNSDLINLSGLPEFAALTEKGIDLAVREASLSFLKGKISTESYASIYIQYIKDRQAADREVDEALRKSFISRSATDILKISPKELTKLAKLPNYTEILQEGLDLLLREGTLKANRALNDPRQESQLNAVEVALAEDQVAFQKELDKLIASTQDFPIASFSQALSSISPEIVARIDQATRDTLRETQQQISDLEFRDSFLEGGLNAVDYSTLTDLQNTQAITIATLIAKYDALNSTLALSSKEFLALDVTTYVQLAKQLKEITRTEAALLALRKSEPDNLTAIFQAEQGLAALRIAQEKAIAEILGPSVWGEIADNFATIFTDAVFQSDFGDFGKNFVNLLLGNVQESLTKKLASFTDAFLNALLGSEGLIGGILGLGDAQAKGEAQSRSLGAELGAAVADLFGISTATSSGASGIAPTGKKADPLYVVITGGAVAGGAAVASNGAALLNKVKDGLSNLLSDIPKLATGGKVRGPGTGRSDSIPAMLSNGEFVVNAKSTAKHAALLSSINSGQPLAAFADGGFVGSGVRSVFDFFGLFSDPGLQDFTKTFQDSVIKDRPFGDAVAYQEWLKQANQRTTISPDYRPRANIFPPKPKASFRELISDMTDGAFFGENAVADIPWDPAWGKEPKWHNRFIDSIKNNRVLDALGSVVPSFKKVPPNLVNLWEDELAVARSATIKTLPLSERAGAIGELSRFHNSRVMSLIEKYTATTGSGAVANVGSTSGNIFGLTSISEEKVADYLKTIGPGPDAGAAFASSNTPERVFKELPAARFGVQQLSLLQDEMLHAILSKYEELASVDFNQLKGREFKQAASLGNSFIDDIAALVGTGIERFSYLGSGVDPSSITRASYSPYKDIATVPDLLTARNPNAAFSIATHEVGHSLDFAAEIANLLGPGVEKNTSIESLTEIMKSKTAAISASPLDDVGRLSAEIQNKLRYGDELRASFIADRINPSGVDIWSTVLDDALGTYREGIFDEFPQGLEASSVSKVKGKLVARGANAKSGSYVLKESGIILRNATRRNAEELIGGHGEVLDGFLAEYRSYGRRGTNPFLTELEAHFGKPVGDSLWQKFKGIKPRQALKSVALGTSLPALVGDIATETAINSGLKAFGFLNAGKQAQYIADSKAGEWPLPARAALFAAGHAVDGINGLITPMFLAGGVGGLLVKLSPMLARLGAGIAVGNAIKLTNSIPDERAREYDPLDSAPDYFKNLLGFASGGKISGAGTGTSDSILARLSHGEYVVNAKSASRYSGLLEAINSGMSLPGFAEGGSVTGGMGDVDVITRLTEALQTNATAIASLAAQAVGTLGNGSAEATLFSQIATPLAGLAQSTGLLGGAGGTSMDGQSPATALWVQIATAAALPPSMLGAPDSLITDMNFGGQVASPTAAGIGIGDMELSGPSLPELPAQAGIFDSFLSGFSGIFDGALEGFGGVFEGLLGSLSGIFSGGGGGSAGGSAGGYVGLALQAYSLFAAGGGYISGPGGSKSDSIPAMLSNGEYVVNAAATKKFKPLIAAMNAGAKIPAFATGGYVSNNNSVLGVQKTAAERSQTATSNVSNINFALEGDFDSRSERAIRKFINSGSLQSGLNRSNIENGGQPVFKGR